MYIACEVCGGQFNATNTCLSKVRDSWVVVYFRNLSCSIYHLIPYHIKIIVKNHILYFLNTCASIVSTLDISICHIVARKWAIFKLLDQSTPTYQVVPKWKDYKRLDQNLHPLAIAKLLYGGCTFLFYLRHEPPKRKRLCRRILDQPATYRKRHFSSRWEWADPALALDPASWPRVQF